MKRSAKTLLILLPSLTALVALGLWFIAARPLGSAAKSAGSSDPAAAPAEVAGAPAASSARLAGESRRYELELENRFGQAGNDDEAEAFHLRLSASLAAQPLEAPTGSQRLQLSELSFRDGTSGQIAEEEHVAKLRGALGQPFVVRFDASGRVSELAFDFAADAFAEGLLRTLAAALQFVPPGHPSSNEWSALELDTVGEANVRYRKLAPRSYLKTKQSYRRLLTDAGLKEPAAAGVSTRVESTAQIDRDGAGALERLRLNESVTSRAGELSFVNAVALNLRLAGGAPKLATAETPKRRAGLDQLPEREPVDPQRAQRELLGNVSFGALKAELVELRDDDVEARRGLQERLTAAIELSRGDAKELEPVVLGSNETAAAVALGALADADTPAAQAALRDITEADGAKPELRESALAFLGLAEAPTAESTELAREISADAEHPSQRTATLALGNMAQNLLEQGDEAGKQLTDELFQRLKAAESPDEQALLIAALGNTGDPKLPELLAPWLQHSAAELRASAVWSLRLVENERAFTLLSTQALGDASPEVRSKAVGALRYRHAERALAVLGDVLRKDRDANVRLEALSTLGQSDSPEALPLVVWVAQNDTDPSVKQQAASMLEGRG